MKTTLDIPEDELKEAIQHTGAKTKRGGAPGGLDDLFQSLLPGPARDQLPLIQPDFEPSVP